MKWFQLVLVPILVLTSVIHAWSPATILWNSSDIVDTKKRLDKGDPSLKKAISNAIDQANRWFYLNPYSVLNKSYTPPSGDKHDYMSLDKYWWPCNAPPQGHTSISSDPMCKTGIPHSGICCLAKCGVCGGSGCADRPGGKDGCCLGTIASKNISCDNSAPPCIIDMNYCDKKKLGFLIRGMMDK